jgi:hypothetical protein
MVCFVYLYPTRPDWGTGTPDGGGYCDRNGRFGPGSGGGIQGYGFGTRFLSDYDEGYVGVFGIEAAGARIVYYTGPRGSQIYSPLTSLIDAAGGQDRVKRAFGLDTGVFALAEDRDLTTFDPAAALASSDDTLRREGARIAAANLRATAAVAGMFVVQLGGVPDPYGSHHFDLNYPRLGSALSTNSNFLFQNARMTEVLTALVPAGRYRADVLSAAAHLIDAYAAAIGVQVADNASAARFSLGISGYLQPELAALLQANTPQAAAAVSAVTSQTILDRTAIFGDTVPFPTTGLFFPAPNFFVGASGTPLTIRSRWNGADSVLSNDLYANGPTGAIGFFSDPASEVVSISVPAARAGELTATLSADTITVNAAAGFRGTSYFDYRVRHPSGEEGIARIYVLFR